MRDCRTRGETPLHRAAAFGDAEAVQLLLDAGAVIDARDANGDTPGPAPRLVMQERFDQLERKMSNDLKAPAEATRPRPALAGTLARFALIGVALAAVAGSFAYLGGWFTPKELTPARFTDGFEEVNGVHSGFRRNHAKGVGVSGFFESNGQGVRLSKAVVFQRGRVPVLGRFSLGGGQPYAADAPEAVRGLGLEFSLPDGELWRTAMINLPVFPFRTPEAFYEQLLATKPDPETGKPDPAKMKEFLEHHPETVQALAAIKSQPASSGFENSTFHGLNAFRFTNAAGDSIPVRWVLTPEQSVEAASTAAAVRDKNYLFDGLIAAIHRQPLRWHLIVIIGQPGDPTNDATIAWPAGREQVDVGTVTLDQVESDDTSPARDINFDPLVLPAGIAPSDDPLLSARSAVYSQSFTRRAGETKQPSAITPAEVHKGE
jgi:catalase